MTRVLVCGGRTFGLPGSEARDFIWACLDALIPELGVFTVVNGLAEGADDAADQWAMNLHKETGRQWPKPEGHPMRREPGGGPRRNARMLDALLDARPLERKLVVAFPGGDGTKDMVLRSVGFGVEVRRVGWTAGAIGEHYTGWLGVEVIPEVPRYPPMPRLL